MKAVKEFLGRQKLIILGLFLMSFCLWADNVVVPPTTDEWLQLISHLGGWFGLGVMGVVVAVVQALMLFFRSSLSDFAGKYKLVIVLGLTWAAGVTALKLTGVSWSMAFLSSTNLAALQVFAHQVYVQFFGGTA